MSLSVRERPYEVVVRILPDGSCKAHVGRIQEVVDEAGNVQAGMARELPVEPFDLAGAEFGPLIGQLNAEVLAGNVRLAAERDDAVSRAAEAQARAADLEAQLAAYRQAA